MRTYKKTIRLLCLCLVFCLTATTLSACESINEAAYLDNEVIFSTFAHSEKSNEAFKQTAHDLQITFSKRSAYLTGLPLVQLYEYRLTFDVFEKGNTDNLLASYTVTVEEVGTPFLERNPYDVMVCDSVTEAFPMKMIEITDDWARYITLEATKNGNLDEVKKEHPELVNDVRLAPVDTLRDIVTEYGQSFIDEKKDTLNVLTEVASCVEYFLVDYGIQGWLKGAIVIKGKMPDYMDKDKVKSIAEKEGDFMGKDSLIIISKELRESLLLVTNEELDLYLTNINEQVNAITEAILATSNG